MRFRLVINDLQFSILSHEFVYQENIDIQKIINNLKIVLISKNYKKIIEDIEHSIENDNISNVTDYKNLFLREHGIHSQKVMTQSGFLAEITAKLGNKVTNLDKFKEGNVMVWRQKDKDGNLSMAGYYAIDSLLSEDLDEESVAKLRFLGNNKNPVSPAGMPLFYSGPELYHYLSGCSQDGTIDFIDGSELEQEVIKDGSKIRTDDEVKEVLREKF